jgi:putative two-component system response regulator
VNPRILVADDLEANVTLLRRILTRAGYTGIHSVRDGREVVPACDTFDPDIVLLDLHMPGADGLDVLDALRRDGGSRPYLPVIVLTGDVSADARLRSLTLGASDYLTKPFDPDEVLLRVRNQLEVRRLHLALGEENRTLDRRVRERTAELDAAQVEMLDRLAAAAELRDDMTGEHTRRVGELSAQLAIVLGESAHRVDLIRRAAPLHDVGKIAIPDAVLRKAGPLSADEFETMKTHTTIGASILAGGQSELVITAQSIAWCHHERWDGRGYPRQLAQRSIPKEARMVAVADVFDALTHDRPYRGALPVGRVLAMIAEGAATQFDADVVAALSETAIVRAMAGIRR